MSTGVAATPVREAIEAAVDALAAAGVEDPRLDAELMLSEATGWERAKLAADSDAGISPGAARLFGAMIRRRTAREPLAYITGRKGFRGIELAVDPRVLIPRPESELLVEVALELKPETVLDVGTGSGAVALAVADELPEARVTGTDTSEGALAVARSNARLLGLAGRTSFQPGTLPPPQAAPGREAEEAAFDVVLANLPYVSEGEWEGLAPEIREHEPRTALVAGGDGLEAIRSLLEAVSVGTPPPAIALEVGAGQADPVAALAERAGFGTVEARPDLAGIERVVLGRR